MEEWLELQQLLDDWREGASPAWVEAAEYETQRAFLRFLWSLGDAARRLEPDARPN
jgi:hypothetical protein